DGWGARWPLAAIKGSRSSLGLEAIVVPGVGKGLVLPGGRLAGLVYHLHRLSVEPAAALWHSTGSVSRESLSKIIGTTSVPLWASPISIEKWAGSARLARSVTFAVSVFGTPLITGLPLARLTRRRSDRTGRRRPVSWPALLPVPRRRVPIHAHSCPE